MGNKKLGASCSTLGVTFTVRESGSPVNPLTSLHLLSQLESETTNDLKKKKFPWPDFCGDTVGKNLPANARETGSNPGLGRYHLPWSN